MRVIIVMEELYFQLRRPGIFLREMCWFLGVYFVTRNSLFLLLPHVTSFAACYVFCYICLSDCCQNSPFLFLLTEKVR